MLKVEVKQEDIDKGIRKNSNSCPIAKAIERQYGKKAKVHSQYVYLGKEKYHTSTRMQEFIRKYDYEDVASPTCFRIQKTIMQ